MSFDCEGQGPTPPPLPQLRPITRKLRQQSAVPCLLPHLPNQSPFEIESDIPNTSLPPSTDWSRRQENLKRTAERHRKNGKFQRTVPGKTRGTFTAPLSPRKEETPVFNGNKDRSSRTDTATRFPQIAVPKPKEKKRKNVAYHIDETAEKAIVIKNSNVTLNGQQTIISPRKNGKTKQKRKFLNDLQSRLAILQEETQSQIEEKNNLFQIFIKTRAYMKAKETLLKNKFLLIKSKPGDGASSMSMKILHDLTEQHDWMIPLRIAEVTDFDEAIGGTNSVILIDGLFGLDSMSLEYKKEWIEKLQRLAPALQVNKRNNYIIITMPEDAYDYLPNCLLESNFFQSALIDITHENNNLTFEEKKLFLNQYVVPFFKLESLQCLDLINTAIPFGFPKCCEIFHSNCSLHEDPFSFFRDPQIFIQGVLELIQKAEPSRLAPLAIVLLSNGTLSERQLYSIISKRNNALWRTFEDHYEGLVCERKDVKCLIHRAKGTFLQFDRITNQWTFTHSAIQKAVVCLLGRIDPKPVIKTCELSLLPQMRTGTGLCRSKDGVLLEHRCFKALSKQIYNNLSKREGRSLEMLSKMSIWEEMKFVEYFAQFLYGNNGEETFLLQDATNRGIIEYAMSNGNNRVVEHMLFIAEKIGQSKQLLDRYCETDFPLALILLNKGVKPDVETIQSGIKSKNTAILRETLIRLGKNFDQFARIQSKITDDFSYDVTIADEACLSGDEKVVATIIENFPKLVSSTKESSFLILLKAAITGGNCQIVNRMVEMGVDDWSSTVQDQMHKNSLVFYIACKNGETEVAKYFGNGDVSLFTSRDKNNYTPLHSVACGGTKELAEYLIHGGADPYAVTTKRATALHLSCASGNLDITAFLIDSYPKLVEVEDNKKATPVHYATRGGSIEIITLLVERNANLAKVTTRRETVLHVSCHRGYLDIARLVVARCPELASAATADGYTALHFACTTDDLDLVRFLVEDLHLDPLQRTNDGNNSIQLATGYGIREYLERICVSQSFASIERFQCDSDDEDVPEEIEQ